MKKGVWIALSALVAGVALLPANASAMTTTLGQLAPGSSPPANCGNGPHDLVAGTVAEGNGYTVPASGTITKWSTNAAAGDGQMLKLKVFRYLFGSTWLVVAHDGPRSLTPGVINTFDVSIPVRAGDVIGLNESGSNNACDFYTGSSGDGYGDAVGDANDGAQVNTQYFHTIQALLNVTATLVRPDPPSYPLHTTGARAFALKKCKKRADKHHWSHARLRACKKKANLLPV